jgi:hypothetical protein
MTMLFCKFKVLTHCYTIYFSFVGQGVVFVESFLGKTKGVADGWVSITVRPDCVGESHINVVHSRDNRCQVQSAVQEILGAILEDLNQKSGCQLTVSK